MKSVRRRAQITFLDRFPTAKTTPTGRILAMLTRAIDWSAIIPSLEARCEYPRPGSGRRPWPFDVMARILVLRWLFGLNDRTVEEALTDWPDLAEFCQLAGDLPRPPDSETIGGFRRRLRRYSQEEAIVDAVRQQLAAKGVDIIPGSLVEPRWNGPDL
jgi:IS5 family transposase